MKMNLPSNSQEAVQAASVEFYPFVLRVAARIAPYPDMINDIAQQSILVLIKEHRRWEKLEDPRAVLAGIVRNVAKEQQRQWNWARPEKIRRISERLLQVRESDGNRQEHADDIVRLNRCLDKLPPEFRFLLDQYYKLNRSHEEIAATSGRSPRAICQILYRIRNALRRCVDRS